MYKFTLEYVRKIEYNTGKYTREYEYTSGADTILKKRREKNEKKKNHYYAGMYVVCTFFYGNAYIGTRD